MSSAREMETQVRSNADAPTQLSDFANFEEQSQRMLNLGFKLASAHRSSKRRCSSIERNSNSRLKRIKVPSGWGSNDQWLAS